jgi:hypothetical protein
MTKKYWLGLNTDRDTEVVDPDYSRKQVRWNTTEVPDTYININTIKFNVFGGENKRTITHCSIWASEDFDPMVKPIAVTNITHARRLAPGDIARFTIGSIRVGVGEDGEILT